jgi:hypothetical protein
VILVISWACLVAAGIGIAFSPTRYPAYWGWLALAGAGLFAAITVDRWVKILPFFLGMATLNALLAVVNGYIGASPVAAFPRVRGMMILISLIISSVLAATFASRKLNYLDRVALLAFLASMVWSIAKASMAGFCAMVCYLAIAWTYDWQRSRTTRAEHGGNRLRPLRQ